MKLVFKTPKNENYFFGYYDKSPLNRLNTKILACRSKFINRMPRKKDTLEIGYFNWKTSNQFIKIAETSTWNWQQGCMLQWFGNKEGDKIIYNDLLNDQFISIIYNLETNEKTILPMAYYTASNNGDFLLCIDNERHYFFRPGYCYEGVTNFNKNVPILEQDGIWRTDIKTNTVTKIITLKQLIRLKPLSIMTDAVHYVEHLMISPNDKRFLFMHRWSTKDGGVYARLYSCNTDGNELFLLNDSGRMSHYSWKNSQEIVGWGGISNSINSLRKYKKIVKYLIKPLMPIYKFISGGNSVDGNTKLSSIVSGDSYLTFNDQTNKKERLAKSILLKDGHPSFSLINDNLMITDTYPIPHNNYEQELILFDLNKNNIVASFKLNHPEKMSRSGYRCDLHPKWSIDGRFVSIDTLDRGYRSMYLYEI